MLCINKILRYQILIADSQKKLCESPLKKLFAFLPEMLLKSPQRDIVIIACCQQIFQFHLKTTLDCNIVEGKSFA